MYSLIPRVEKREPDGPRVTVEKSVDESGPSGDDSWHPLCNLICGDNPVKSLEVRCHWKDQGWGNAKCTIRTVLEQDGQEVECEDNFGTFGSRRRPPCGEYLQVRKTFWKEDAIVATATKGSTYKFQYYIGGGGGHEIHIKNFSATIGVHLDVESEICAELDSLATGVIWAGAANFIFIPIAFASSCMDLNIIVTSLIIVQASVGLYSQIRLSNKSVHIARVILMEVLCDDEALARLESELMDMYKAPCSLGVPMFLMYSLKLLMSLPEFWDPVTDAATAAAAGSMLNEDADVAFRRSFADIPLMSILIDNFGLYGVLCTSLFISTSTQLYFFVRNMYEMRCVNETIKNDLLKGYEDDTAFDVAATFRSMAGLCVTASLGHLAEVQDCLRQSMANQRAEKQSAWMKAGCKGILEAVPSVWFTTSLVGLSLHFNPDADVLTLCMPIFSIVVSIGTMITAGKESMFVLKEYSTDFNNFARLLGILLISAALVLAVRAYMKIFGCSTHNFSVVEGCLEWS